MEQQVKAIYHAGQLQLLENVELVEGQEVTISIVSKETSRDDTSEIEASLAMLRSWLEEEDYEGEQKETLEYLMRVLDEDRLSYRKLFL